MKLLGWLKPREKVPTIYVRAGTTIRMDGPAPRSLIIEVAPADLELDHGTD